MCNNRIPTETLVTAALSMEKVELSKSNHRNDTDYMESEGDIVISAQESW